MVQMVLETPVSVKTAEKFCQEILPEVSRTFAISIRFLPGTLGRAVLVAYLICRIADTIEDDPLASITAKTALLDHLLECFDSPSLANHYGHTARGVQGEAAHVRLVENTNLVFAMYRNLPIASQQHVRRWVSEMVHGMKKFVTVHPQGIRIQTLAEYKEYCYYVAGTVGYLLTDLWQEHSLSIGANEYQVLLKRCGEFGEALQTVNILKDIAWDAEHENSIYVPQDALIAQGSSHQLLLSPDHLAQNHAAIKELIALAWHDLDQAQEYLLSVPKAAVPIRLFCVLPLLFAYATLRDLTQSTAMLQPGGSVKISRAEVKSLMLMGPISILSNHTLRWLIAQVRQKPFILPTQVNSAS
ncbi:phytoene/squalene synthase family protein [Candidatus Synechococcus calcipolaris G9]|uniref:Phytoene/squalene synthase family protein n=1 Tax=Candidatus Synechococcus calcipolaris G9 TaxID=1497997 RepID=A0ABT6EXR9_9SYNE|nr:phytoene/squalene synthase family protein [Candidatus Synechococcus calcipolaris]MDG2990036.1 phytoene/squalene synthase family protein [Candidatus Synechococcus calcipolaris G9]